MWRRGCWAFRWAVPGELHGTWTKRALISHHHAAYISHHFPEFLKSCIAWGGGSSTYLFHCPYLWSALRRTHGMVLALGRVSTHSLRRCFFPNETFRT